MIYQTLIVFLVAVLAATASARKEPVANPGAEVTPDWLANAAEYHLPEWYDRWRVSGHTRWATGTWKNPEFFRLAEHSKALGLHSFVRQVKSAGEGAWWPSRVGGIQPGLPVPNLAKVLLDDAKRRGLQMIAYYRHMEDRYVAEEHPDWVARNFAGKPYSKRGIQLCFNSPYAEFVRTRLLELADMGARAFYFDSFHMPKDGCWCGYCKKKFKEETGLDHPAAPDPKDPLWRRLQTFNNETMERAFLEWRRALHRRDRRVVMLIGNHSYPALVERHLTHRLMRIADSVKTEFATGNRNFGRLVRIEGRYPSMAPEDARVALGYVLSRDAADGRPPHVWINGLRERDSAKLAVAGVIAHGGIANLDFDEKEIPDFATFKDAIDLGNRISPWFAGTKPLRWAAIHHNEYAHEQYATDMSRVWRRILSPEQGAYLTLLRARLPVGIVVDSQLEQGLLEGYQVLFLPEPTQLTARMRAAVAAFRKRGGHVIENDPTWTWHTADGRSAAMLAFAQELAPRVANAPVTTFGGPEKMHMDAFRAHERKRVTVGLVNDFTKARVGPLARLAEGRDALVGGFPPPAIEGVTLTFRGLPDPKKSFDAVTGKKLTAKRTSRGLEIAVPAFDVMAVVVVEY